MFIKFGVAGAPGAQENMLQSGQFRSSHPCLWRTAFLFGALLALAGCSTLSYTVDDGRPVNERLLNNIRLLGEGERKLRPAILRAAQLKDPDCSTQWELPFSIATSYDLAPDDKVAWVRALQVDERLSVIGVGPDSEFSVGDKLIELDEYKSKDSAKMLKKLGELREDGEPFFVRTALGKRIQVTPVKLCRGYARLASPDNPAAQDYHWLASTHPLEIFNPPLTPDEALWVVLWSEGLSEEGGVRMKTFHYGKTVVMTALEIASWAVGLNGAAQAAKLAASQISSVAATQAAKAASQEVAKKVIEQAAQDAAEAAAKEYARKIGQQVISSLGSKAGTAVTGSFMSRVGYSISAVSWVATSKFDAADAWAFQRMKKLGADPMAGATLHRKLIDRGLTHNAFAFDDERLGALAIEARKAQSEAMFMAAIRGASLEDFSLQLGDLPSSVASGEQTTLQHADEENKKAAETGKTDTPNEAMPTSMPGESQRL